jgi:hypothetical protein
MVLTTITLATTLMAHNAVNVPLNKPMNKMPMLKISRVAQIDNLDQGDALGANRADFYANVWINGKMTKTKSVSDDDAHPDWMIPLDTTKRYNKIKIAVWDDDGGFERTDDHADIHPAKGKKDITFTYDRYTARIWGDLEGYFGQTLVSIGGGDDDNAKIELSIVK